MQSMAYFPCSTLIESPSLSYYRFVFAALFEAALKSNLNHVDPFIGYDKVSQQRGWQY